MSEGTKKPEVSVIVPVYNVEQYLNKCVDSILAQTYGGYELLLIDDGSTDASGTLCDRLGEKDGRIRVIHQENEGLGGARNTGIEASLGKWLFFVDSDDYLEPGILESALQAAKQAEAQVVLFPLRSVDEAGNTISEVREPLPAGQALKVREHKDLFLASPCACSKLYRASLFRDTGVRFPSRVWYEDIRTTLKLYLKAEKAVYLDEIGYNYLLREGSITNNRQADRNREILDAFEDVLAYFRKVGKFREYEDELCYLTVFHVYLTACVRVLRIDRHHPLLSRFREYLYGEFPNWKENPYLPRLGKRRKLILWLLERKQYGLIDLLFRLKG